MPDKRQQLLELKERYLREHPDLHLWFFEDLRCVADGYLGTDRVMFVAERPSLGGQSASGHWKGGAAKNSDRVLTRFFDRLAAYGFEHAHVTDVVKEAKPTGQPISDAELSREWPYFLEELAIVEPEAVVAIGGQAFRILKSRLQHPEPLVRFTHYAYRYRPRDEIEERFSKEFRRLRARLDGTKG